MTRWFKDSNKILLAWGAMDIFHLTRYSLKAWQAGNIPYLTDLMNTLALGSELGLPSLMMAVASWGLQLSIILTAILFLCGYRPARYLGLAQIPFRLLFIYPSITPILMAGSYWAQNPLPLVLLLLASEALKGWTLWKHA